jgi:hypothetical protein
MLSRFNSMCKIYSQKVEKHKQNKLFLVNDQRDAQMHTIGCIDTICLS